MSENINISFIPKKPLARKDVLRRRPVFGIVFVVSLTVALVSIGFATSGYYALKAAEQEKESKMLEFDKYIAQLKEEKDDEGKTLIDRINEERAFVQRTKIAKVFLENHVAPSKIFKYLEETTPTKVAYQNFSYIKDGDKVTINMRGKVGSYALLASLSQWYKDQSDVITELTFGGFNPNTEGGVSFSFQGVLYPNLISYVEKTDKSEDEINYLILENENESENLELGEGYLPEDKQLVDI